MGIRNCSSCCWPSWDRDTRCSICTHEDGSNHQNRSFRAWCGRVGTTGELIGGSETLRHKEAGTLSCASIHLLRDRASQYINGQEESDRWLIHWVYNHTGCQNHPLRSIIPDSRWIQWQLQRGTERHGSTVGESRGELCSLLWRGFARSHLSDFPRMGIDRA